MEIITVTEYSTPLHQSINNLLPQLSDSNRPISQQQLKQLIDSDSQYLLVVKDGENYLGCLTLIIFKVLLGTKAWIDDVVVAESARGHGLGKTLVTHAIDIAREQGAEYVDLTSRPARQSANRLYRKMGFELRETNAYRYLLTNNRK